MAKKESQIQSEIKDGLEGRGWLVEVTTCNAYQKGFPDLYCHHPEHGYRWIDVKRPSGSVLTKAQCQVWPVWTRYGVGIWIMVADTEDQYQLLFGPPNWEEWWKPRYNKYLLRDPAAILEEFNAED